MRTPKRQNIKLLWEPTAQLILRLAGKDRIVTTDKLRDEFRDNLKNTWKCAGCPTANDDQAFLKLLQECYAHARDPKGPPARCAIWHDGKSCYIHLLSLSQWLSTPGGGNHGYDWDQIRKALLLLDFVPERAHRSVNNECANVRLWRGPLDLLVDDES
jgi:hypothetical protein